MLIQRNVVMFTMCFQLGVSRPCRRLNHHLFAHNSSYSNSNVWTNSLFHVVFGLLCVAAFSCRIALVAGVSELFMISSC